MKVNENKKLIAVAGPTASGKTALAVQLALHYNGEVVSNDSMQIYKGMEIGTAAPTIEERLGVPHHLVGICSPDTDFSCADYSELGKNCANEIISRGKLPVFCGGTGLYLDAVTSISNYSEGVKNETLREALTREAEELGNEAVHAKLRAVDPEAADAIHPNNVRRVIRAIEIYETTGVPKTEWDRRSKDAVPPFDAKIVVLEFLNRELLYERIDRRVDMMIEAGLEAEARKLFAEGLISEKSPAYQAIGYKELLPYFAGEETLAEGADRIRQNSRRYAKRQITWFKRYKNAIVIHPDNENGMRDFRDIVDEAIFELNKVL
ncbi:MAG: tRNA (adenosine(37)-N6)-dimethylallyltransferase MiaA [Clostridia bacterium]|nr:tRNA (adenosine(37)-N6)-dimethylallyltransferase MiaA [Clostridia bacterium]